MLKADCCNENWVTQAEALMNIQYSESEQAYDAVAEKYEEMVAGIHYNAHVELGRQLSKVVPNLDACMLDVGCGTGLAGAELVKLGYRCLHGVDGSAKMLKLVAEKGIYVKLVKSNFGPNTPLEYADGFFDVVFSSGCFTPGHLKETCLPEMIRLVKPGGYIINCTRKKEFDVEMRDMKLKTALIELTKDGTLSRISHEEGVYSTEKGQDKPSITLTYQVPDLATV